MSSPRIPTTLLALISILGSTLAFAQSDGREYASLKINQTDMPAFPPGLMNAGIKEGAASIAISVDETGRLEDVLVTAYNHEAFANEAVASIRKWTFEPARIRGVAVRAKADVTFRFEIQGVVVVSLDLISANELVHLRVAPNSPVYVVHSLSQLDRVPARIAVVSPSYDRELARKTMGGHIEVEFYIDENGRVRMPSVSLGSIESSEDLTGAAVSAVAQWRYEAPLSNGRPVVALARQVFDFKPSGT
jgi:TonB family protein